MEFTSPNTLILFDNGILSGSNQRLWSRALEYRIDEANRTAEIIWEYRGEARFFAAYWGDADRLANGHALVSAGNWDSGRTSFLFEADVGARTVWTLEFGSHRGYTIGFFNACRLLPPVKRLIPSPG